MTPRTALVLAGHGSHISPETAGLVWQHVDTLRHLGVADEVTAAFWKEAPAFHDVFCTLTADDITVVPLFTARGYFTQTVIPAEMGIAGQLTERYGRIIRYADIVAEHPVVEAFARLSAKECLKRIGKDVPPDQVAVAVIGHSTERNPESRRATEAQAESVRAAGLVGEVVTVYLDDSPEIAKVYQLTTAPIIIAVPYFLASGSHVSIDVPERLGLQPGQTVGQVQGRTVYYTRPVITDRSLHQVVHELAQAAGMPAPSMTHGSKIMGGNSTNNNWHHFPQSGREALNTSVLQAGTLSFGELALTKDEVRHLKDADYNGHLTPIPNPTLLRSIGRGTKLFRPLSTTHNLSGGWRVPLTYPEQLPAVVETIYPGAVADWAAYQAGTLHIESLETVVARQTGMFRALKDLPASARFNTVESVCGGCVRHPTWHFGTSPKDAIPCAAPCNWWMSHALKVLESQNPEVVEA